MESSERRPRIESTKGTGAGFVYLEQDKDVYSALYDDTETLRSDVATDQRFFICEFIKDNNYKKVYVIAGANNHIDGKAYLEKLKTVMKNSKLGLYDLNGFEVKDDKYYSGENFNCSSASPGNIPEPQLNTVPDDL